MVADVEILTEDTAHVAAGEEYRTGTSPPDQNAFFAEMGADGTYDRLCSDAAKSRLSLSPMGSTLSWTERTRIYGIPQPSNRLIRLIAHRRSMVGQPINPYFENAVLISSIETPSNAFATGFNDASEPRKWKVRWVWEIESPGCKAAAGDDVSNS